MVVNEITLLPSPPLGNPKKPTWGASSIGMDSVTGDEEENLDREFRALVEKLVRQGELLYWGCVINVV